MNNICICLQSLIAVRKEASETSEMVTQLLFGEQYIIHETHNNWALIKIINDKYEGWIDKKVVIELNNEQQQSLNAAHKHINNNALSQLNVNANNTTINIPGGSELYLNKNSEMQIAKNCFSYKSNNTTIALSKIAKQYLNAPYLWGGKSLFGIDCSGLMQVIFKSQEILLPRDASQQAEIGANVSFIHDAAAGDLAFFDNDEGRIIHVGMLLNSNTIIHASGWVRIDPIDHQGIYKNEDEKYSHRLRIIKRILK